MTRLEKIRSMSAEEWAKEIMEKSDFDKFCCQRFCKHHKDGHCEFFSDGWGADITDEQLDAACREACMNYLNAEIEDK